MSAVETTGAAGLICPSLTLGLRHFASENVLFVLGAMIFFGVVRCAIFAPAVAPYEPTAITFAHKLRAPGLEHRMGTDVLGRDIFSRVVYGARTLLVIGITVAVVAVAIGVPIGLVSGYFGGRIDTALMRVSDVFLAFPPLLLTIPITAALGAGLFNAMLAVAISWFPWYARIVRGSVMAVRQELFIDADQHHRPGPGAQHLARRRDHQPVLLCRHQQRRRVGVRPLAGGRPRGRGHSSGRRGPRDHPGGCRFRARPAHPTRRRARHGTAAEELPGRRARLSPYAKGAVSRPLESLGELRMPGGETEPSRSETDRPAPRVAQGS